MCDNTESTTSINSLPDELIVIILHHSEYRDIMYFSMTCKRFYELVNNNKLLWKFKFKQNLPSDIFDVVNGIEEANWHLEFKRFYQNKQAIYSEINAMSPKYYWRTNEARLEDLQNIYDIALSSNFSYYHTIIILQSLIKEGKTILNCNKGEKPYTLTEMYHARVVLRYLIHMFMAVKWIKGRLSNNLLPEIVINYFLQWLDADVMHTDESVNEKIDELVTKVELLIEHTYPSHKVKLSLSEKLQISKITERDIFYAVSQVIYQQQHMAVCHTANLETLDIVKVLQSRCGNIVVVAGIYQAVAQRCGVKCELIVFPNHMFLEWRDVNAHPNPQLYTVDLETGELQRKRRCPFSQNSESSSYSYSPDFLLKYLYSKYHITMGEIKSCTTHNASLLLEFLGTNLNNYNPYNYFVSLLCDPTYLPALRHPLDLKQLHPSHMVIIRTLSNLKVSLEPLSKEIIVKKHRSNVKYAVGMICFHKKYDYVCVILNWDYCCDGDYINQISFNTLRFGPNQPFYYVVAADQSERYVAQENLIYIPKPARLFHLEDLLAPQFTHFDGYSYLPNDEKKIEYPTDGPVRDVFFNKFYRFIT